MKIPLNTEKPSKQDYYYALEELVSKFKSLGSNEIYSLLNYGSLISDSIVPGRSDIDLCLILENTTTNKELLTSLGNIIKEIVKKRRTSIELGIYDRNIMKDGRFFTYGENFKKELEKGKIVYGVDFRPELNLKSWFHVVEQHIGFNLRWLRKKFVEAPYDIETHYDTFANNFNSFLVKLKGLKTDTRAYTGKKISNSAIEETVEIAFDFNKFDKIRRKPELALDIWKTGLSGYEEIVLEIINNYTRPKQSL
ncbi:MAG: hypothetical protein QXP53_01125 [Candidatus Pacearchaeota archaeon]